MFDHLDNPNPRLPTEGGARAALAEGRRRVRRRRVVVGGGTAAAALVALGIVGTLVLPGGSDQEQVVVDEGDGRTTSLPRGGIVGEWTPVAYSAVVVGQLNQLLSLRADGTLLAHDGCNDLTSTWREEDGHLVLTSDPVVTTAACPPGFDDRELHRILISEPRIDVWDGDPATLELRSGDDWIAFGRTDGTKPESGERAVWDIDPDNPPSSESSTFTALVTGVSCNNGITDEVLRPGVDPGEATIVITFNVALPSSGAAFCPGNPPERYQVDLGEPIGDRRLVDGGCEPTDIASTSFCAEGPVRWRPPTEAGAFDPEASTVCPESISSLRLSGGTLVAAYDTTYVGLEEVLGEEDTMTNPPAPDTPVSLCWYEGASFVPPPEMGEPSVVDAVSWYVDRLPVGAASTTRDPHRPGG
jgi:hypothetical protein